MVGCGFSTIKDVACWLGNFSAVVLFMCNIPQLWLNFRRRSTRGFSSTFVIIKLVSYSFQLANSSISKSSFPILFTGFLLLLTDLLYIIQIAFYNKNKKFMLWFLLMFLIFFVAYEWPQTAMYTQWIMPFISLLSYIPLLYTCWESLCACLVENAVLQIISFI